MKHEIVTLPYRELIELSSGIENNTIGNNAKNAHEVVEQAFGAKTASLGILVITEMPDRYVKLRQKLLPFVRVLAKESNASEYLVNAESHYQVGWSHGVEKLQGDQVDVGKGSFYANPLKDDFIDDDSTREQLIAYCKSKIAKESVSGFLDIDCNDDLLLNRICEENPSFFAANIWPDARRDVKLLGFEESFKALGSFIREVGIMVSTLCDSYVNNVCPSYNQSIGLTLQNSKYCKGRALHYYSRNDIISMVGDDQARYFDMQCGWHNDHGSLTGLVPGMYLDENGVETCCPDPEAGLYIKSRDGCTVQISFPANSLAFQIGETAQIHTGGILEATPHAVKGLSENSDGSISRESFAVFMEPEFHWSMTVPEGCCEVQSLESEHNLPPGVKTLRSRFKEGMSFGEFSEATFASFH